MEREYEEEFDRLYEMYSTARKAEQSAKSIASREKRLQRELEEQVGIVARKANAWDKLQEKIRVFGVEQVLKDRKTFEKLEKEFIIDVDKQGD